VTRRRSSPRFLITTGNGRTGSAAATELLRAGQTVRVLVSRDDARAQAWRSRGAEVVVGNMFDVRDLRRAFADVQRVYSCSPFDPRLFHGAMLQALVAEEAGVEVVALMSGWNPHPTHPSVLQREHWMLNNFYRRQAFDVVHINPGLFAFTYLLGLAAAEHMGVLALPFGDGLNAPPSNEDIGAVAAHALMSPAAYLGQCLRPMGPKRVHPSEVAVAVGRALGREVKYRAVSERMFVKFARAQGFPLFQIAQVRHYAAECRAGAFAQEPNDHVLRVTHRAPEALRSTVRRYVEQPTHIMPGLRRGSLLGALGLAVRAAFTPAPDLNAWERSRDYPLIDDGLLAHQAPSWQAAANAGQLVLQSGPRYTPKGGVSPTANPA